MAKLYLNSELYDKAKALTQRNTHLITGVSIAIISQLYISFLVDDFRLSLAVVLLPVFLMTINKDDRQIKVGVAAALCVFSLRILIYVLSSQYSWGQGALRAFPGAFYFFIYIILFDLMIPNKNHIAFKKVTLVCIICDFIPNIMELFIMGVLDSTPVGITHYGYLFLAACVRTALVVMILGFIRWNHLLLNKEEHEERYQNLYLIITELKNEIYFMKKNSEEIEKVMGYAYNLCCQLQEKDEEKELKQLALRIATEVHEIKKDYFRIIQGMEKQVTNQYEDKEMSCKDLFIILRNIAAMAMEDKKLNIKFFDCCNDDFKTKYHYMLMTILKNLVINAIESIESGGKPGEVWIVEEKRDKSYEFVVKDNGPGIADHNVDNIFKAGFSTKFDSKTGNIYRGMGLPAVKMLVEEELGGKIFLINRIDGAAFKISIPEEMLTGGKDENIYN